MQAEFASEWAQVLHAFEGRTALAVWPVDNAIVDDHSLVELSRGGNATINCVHKLHVSVYARSHMSALPAAKSVDPVSLAAWVQYTAKCSTWVDPKAPATECKRLKDAHCSRPDVQCGTETVQFRDLGLKQVVLRGDNSKGLAYLV
jgi:hypothetical protein